jgi:hypothetical protein
MRVFVNDVPVDIFPSMTVTHALINAGLFDQRAQSKKIFDEWGNEVGLEGELSGGNKIYIRWKQ